MVYARVSRGMLHADKAMLALLLMRIYVKGSGDEAYDVQWNHLLGRSDVFVVKDKQDTMTGVDFLSSTQIAGVSKLQKVIGFEKLQSELISRKAEIEEWLAGEHPENNVPQLWATPEKKFTPLGTALHNVLVVHALRADRLLASVHHLVAAVFGDDFMDQDRVVNLMEIAENEVTSSRPLLLCSTAGYDASGKVEDLAVELNKEVTSIAIGSAEGFNQAEKAISNAERSGRWVLLKNVHLAPSWLSQIEKKLHSIKPHPGFRLFLTAEIHPKLPSTILRTCRVLVFEPATGLKANLLRSLSAISAPRLVKAPAERSRLYVLLCWLHALVQERLRYTPLGWANSYEFSDADLRVACDTLDAAVDIVAQGRANVAPEKLPWSTVRTLLSQCIYGGKIDNEFDQTLLDSVLSKLFSPNSFNPEFQLVERFHNDQPLTMPEGSSKESLLSWIENLSPQQMPAWLGLPNNADRVLLTLRAEAMLRNLLKVSDDAIGMEGDTDEQIAKPHWMQNLRDLGSLWLRQLPKDITRLRRTKENIRDPLFRFFEREVNLGATLIIDIRRDLDEILAVCRGEKKQSNEVRALASALQRGQVPSNWLRYPVPRTVTVMDWMTDFGERVKQLQRIAASQALKREAIWLGGLFSPEAYITATRQQVAQANTWSLEQLKLHVSIGQSESAEVFKINGADLRGAKSSGPVALTLSDAVRTPVECMELAWKLDNAEGTKLPLYWYGDRRHFIVAAHFSTAEATKFYERGVAFIASNLA